MGQINLQHEAEVRGKRHHFGNTKADKTRDGTTGHDKVQSVPRLNRSVSAAEDFASGRRGDVSASELVQVNVPITCHHPIGDPLQGGGIFARTPVATRDPWASLACIN